MNAMKKKTGCILISILVLIFAICAFALSHMDSKLEYHLTDEQILSLREMYPICGIKKPENVSMRDMPLKEVKERFDSFVQGEVIGEKSIFTKKVSTGDIELDKKRKANGIKDEYEFFEYTIQIVKDTENKFEKGEQIKLVGSSLYEEYYPEFTNGMEVVIPVIADKNKGERFSYSVMGTYYVTDEGYAISAFDESTAQMRTSYNGIKVEDLLKQLKK
ncbi:MAG: hypothetical protein IJN09_07315 [Oscillospiraceae bacterium]|nr:hypothetical protein [Oscillospiraceae bacterium]